MTIAAVSTPAYAPPAARIAAANVKPLNLKLTPIALPPELRPENVLKGLFMRPVGEPDNAPSQVFAEIKVGDTVIGKVYNSGCCEQPNKYALRFSEAEEAGLSGPALAQFRAEKIAKAFGGTIVKKDTAVSQAEWQARPPREFVFDEDGYNKLLERLRGTTEPHHVAYLRTLALPPGLSQDITA